MNDIDPKTLFEDAARRLDPATANRLRLARRAALAGEPAPRVPWLPTLAAATVLVLGLAWWLPQRLAAPAPATPVAASVDDAAVLSEVDEDTDMYAWLAEAPVASDADGKERSL